jgi:hypothetical protein
VGVCVHYRASYGVGEEADARRRHEFQSLASRFGVVFVACLAVWLLSGAGAFWPGWVLLVGAFLLGRRAVDAYRSTGSDDDNERDEAARVL